MQFNNNPRPIYLQIADYVCEKVLVKAWQAEDKIPSVRELAVQLEVNPNTVSRAYDYLKQLHIIYDKRGIGYFITAEAAKCALGYRRKEFTEKELPLLFRTLYMLDMDTDALRAPFEKFKKNYKA